MQSKLCKKIFFSIELSSTREKLSIVSSIEKIESVVEFENGVMSLFMDFSGKFKLTEFWYKFQSNLFLKKKCSMEISREKIKPVLNEKLQFACRHESQFVGFFQNYRTITFLMQGPNPTILHGMKLPPIESFQMRPWYHDGSNRVSSYGELR